MFAIQAGARVCYAVDSSDIIIQAKQIVADNGFEGKVICLQGKVCATRKIRSLSCKLKTDDDH
jgi:hypothetical protein